MRLAAITADNVKNIWPHLEEFIASACKKGPGNLNPDELRVSCETMQHQLWVLVDSGGVKAAAVTGIFDGDNRRRAEWIAFGGPGTLWQEFMTQIEQWAKHNGCTAFRSYGRPGMQKRMPRGYRVKGVIFEKEL